MNIDKINSNILWEWKGDKEYQETKQAIIDDRKRLQKFANRVASRKRASLKELEACKLFLNTLIDNEKYFKQIKEIRDKAKLVS
jgi:chemotaxis regulatin CheY-phosphate phosphatase CheZ